MLVPPSLGAGAAGNRRASTIHGLANGGKLQVGLSEETVLCVLLAQRASLIGYIWSMAGDAHLVEDVFQEVAVLALEKRGELRDEKALPTWLRRAARLSVLALIRAQKKSPLLLSDATLYSPFTPPNSCRGFSETARGILVVACAGAPNIVLSTSIGIVVLGRNCSDST